MRLAFDFGRQNAHKPLVRWCQIVALQFLQFGAAFAQELLDGNLVIGCRHQGAALAQRFTQRTG
jgi:hypothetical protein